MAIRTKFTIEGLDTIIQQLKTFGRAGEDAAKQLKTAIERINTKKLEQDLKQVAESAKSMASGMLTFRNVLTGTAIGVAATQLFRFADASIRVGEQLENNAAAAGISTQKYQVLGAAIAAAGGSQEQLNTALRKFTQQVDQQGQEQLKSFTDAIEFFVDKTGGVSSVVFKTIQDVNKLQAAAAELAPRFKALFEQLGDPRGSQSIGAIEGQIRRLLEQFPQFAKLVSSLGIDVPSKNIIEKLDDIRTKAKGTFASMGISLIDVNGKLKKSEAVFLEWIDRVSAMGNEAEQAEAIVKVFGRTAGPELAKVIRDGTKGLKEVEDFLRSRGFIITPGQLTSLKAADDALDNLSESLRQVRNQFAIAIAPAFKLSMDSLTDSLTKFVQSGGIDKVKSGFQSLADVAAQIKTGFDNIASVFNAFLGTDITGSQLMIGLAALAALLKTLNPLLRLLIAATAALGQTSQQSLKNIQENQAAQKEGGQTLIDLFTRARNFFKGTSDETTQNWHDTGDAITGAFDKGTAASQKFSQQVTKDSTAAKQAVESIAPAKFVTGIGQEPFAPQFQAPAAQQPGATAEQQKAQALSQAAIAAFQAASERIKQIWTELIAFISNTSQITAAFTSLSEALVAPFLDANEGITSTFEDIAAQAERMAQRIIDAARQAAQAIQQISFSGFGGSAEGAPFAGGGHVRGPGGRTGDRIPAWLSDYEFVQPASRVAQYGVDFMEAIRRGLLSTDAVRALMGDFRGFRFGGQVSVPRFASGGQVGQGSSRTLNLVLDGQTFPVRGQTSVIDALEREASLRSVASAGIPQTFVGRR